MDVHTQTGANEAHKIIGQISAMAMADQEFKSRLMANPSSVVAEFGLEIPPGAKIDVLSSFEDIPAERSPNSLYIVIPSAEGLSREDLSTAIYAAASCQTTASSACTTPSCLSTASSASTNSCS